MMSNYKKIFAYIGKSKFSLILSIVFSFVGTSLSLYIPIVIGKSIDCIAGTNNVDFDKVLKYLYSIVVFTIVIVITQWVSNVLNNRISFKIVREFRNKTFSKIHNLPVKYLDENKPGEILNRVISDADQFSDGLILGLTQLFSGIVTIIGTLILMFYINWVLAIVVVILTPLSFLLAKFISKRTYKMFKLQSETRAAQSSFVDEISNNLKVSKIFSHANEDLIKFDEINEELAGYSMKATFYSSITNPGTRFVNAIVYACIATIGAIISIKNNFGLTIGILSSFLAYATQYTKPFNEISGVITEFQNSLACANRVFSFLDEAEIKDVTQGNKLEHVKGNVVIDDVSFGYDETKMILHNININAKPGMKIAIVGPTGCGKTTIINLLMDYYQTNYGKISIDNNLYDDLSTNAIRSSYGMVMQDTWIKSGSVFENISYGCPKASLDDVIDAAKKANAHSFITKLPNGYDTIIDENASNLSQGQKQLICISRLMLMDSPILILDEATSNIDTRTEMKIGLAFDNLMKNKTSFIVAHRLSTIKNADLILVMNDGKVMEQGNHEQLLKLNGLYSQLYFSQFNVNN